MGVIKEQGIRSSFVAYVGVALGAINTLWVYPRFLGPEEIGLITVLTNVSLLIAPIAQLGVNGIILKYYNVVKDDVEKSKSFLFFITLIPTIGFIISMILLFALRDTIINYYIEQSPLFVDFLFVLVPFSFLIVARNIIDTLSRAQFKVAIPKLLRDVALRLILFICVFLYFTLDLSLSFLIGSVVIAYAINTILAFFYLKKLRPIQFRLSLSPLGRELIKESLTYGGYIILSGFAGMVILKIDSLMIASKLNLENTGIFTIASYIGLAIDIPKRSLVSISLPVIGKEIENKNYNEVAKIYSKTSIIQLLFGSIIFICVWLNIEDLFALIPNTEVYIQGKYVVLFIGLAVLFDLATGVNNEIIMMSNFYKWNLIIVSSLIIIAIINNLIFIPLYGINGAALATAISIFLHNIFKSILVYFKLKIHPFSNKTIFSILISLSIFGLSLLLPDSSIPIINILYKSALMVSAFVFLHYRLHISNDFNAVIIQLINRVRRAIK